MWPTSGPLRRKLANHLLLSGHDPIYLATLFSNSITITVENGLVSVDNSPIAFEASITHNETPLQNRPVPASDLTLLSLHILWHGLHGRAPIIASFVQSRLVPGNPNIRYWQTLYSDLAWILTPPQPILTAMRVGRPDLQYRVQRYYMRWLHITRSPVEIVSALDILTSSPLHFSTWTKVWQIASRFLGYNSTQLAAVGSAGMYPSDCVVVPKAGKYQLVINAHGCLAISERDILLLLLQLLFDEKTGFVTLQCVPPDAPKQFHTVAETHAYMFDATKSAPAVNFDELDPINTTAT